MSTDPTFQKIIATNDFFLHRKPLIQKLQEHFKAKVITYIASLYHPVPMIMAQDIPLFEDLLRSSDSDEGCLIINSPGGDGNVAEKIITMCRQRFTKSFQVIVPNFAKSAATMVALGSDKILMGYLAELGPIDPQLGNPVGGGLIPARSFIDGLEMVRHYVKDCGDPVEMYLPVMAKIRPEIIAQSQSAIDNSRKFAEKWLKNCMLKNNPKQAEKVAKMLSEGVEYKSHGKVIDYTEAHDVLQLNVEKISEQSEIWSKIWELYCRSILFLQNSGPAAAKLFESEKVSLTMNMQILGGPLQIQPLEPPKLPIRLPQGPLPQPQRPQPSPAPQPQTSPPETQQPAKPTATPNPPA
jgi:Serine dehydrogenase proteinase